MIPFAFPAQITLCLALLLQGSDPRFTPMATASDIPPANSRVTTRLFFQDDEAKTIRWADVVAGETPQLKSVEVVAGFPSLDAKRQDLVQMKLANGILLVGVRDHMDGKFQSGWVLIDSGVEQDDHGDHSHWQYLRTPRVRASVLDDKQGNPAHVYCYDDGFFLANDRLNGFTWLDTSVISARDDATTISQKAAFHQGGGGHITLAAVNRKFAFASWIDRDGPNKGRVDRTVLNSVGNKEIDLTLHLPYGGIHGATANEGKVFFAPADGICWFDSSSSTTAPKIHHISLGKDGDRSRRTGAFTNHGSHVAFVTGTGESAALCFLDASLPVPGVSRLPLNFKPENQPTAPELISRLSGAPLAFVFQDHPMNVTTPHRLLIASMDPNGDRDWHDAKVIQDIEVGRAKVEGHGGHHCVAFDGDRRFAIFTNPGDGTISVMSLDDLEIASQFTVGGVPSKLIAIGGSSSSN